MIAESQTASLEFIAEEPTMRQLRTGFLLAVFVSAIAVSGQQVASGGSFPADILYPQPGQQAR
jgi:hypothetical protein